MAGKKSRDPSKKLNDHFHYILEVVDAHSQQSGKVEQHVEQIIWLRQAKKMLKQGQVPRAGDRQELSYALDKPQNSGHRIGQCIYLLNGKKPIKSLILY